MQKLLKTIRLDISDTFIFPKASSDEWAVVGSFMFFDAKIDELDGKNRQAFRSGFLGVESLGFSTLVVVQKGDKQLAIEALAHNILNHFNAPSLIEARAVATQEIEASILLANHDEGTLIAMHRVEEGDGFREIFRTLKPKEGVSLQDNLHENAKAFTFHEIEEEVDLMGLLK